MSYFRIDPSHIFLPNLQHPEVALLASATPSPMTPSEEKIPSVDLDMVNNNKTKEKCPPVQRKKLHIKASKLPTLTKALLSPTASPRNPDHSAAEEKKSAASTSSKGPGQRNLTKTVTTRLLSGLSKAGNTR